MTVLPITQHIWSGQPRTPISSCIKGLARHYSTTFNSPKQASHKTASASGFGVCCSAASDQLTVGFLHTDNTLDPLTRHGSTAARNVYLWIWSRWKGNKLLLRLPLSSHRWTCNLSLLELPRFRSLNLTLSLLYKPLTILVLPFHNLNSQDSAEIPYDMSLLPPSSLLSKLDFSSQCTANYVTGVHSTATQFTSLLLLNGT